ncbi:hypothetical protein Tco_1569819 [Tanacetum coccineum]
MITRAMAKQLSVASAHECLFVDFLFEEEPKKVSEALKHLRSVDTMQDELNQFARNKVWPLVPTPYGSMYELDHSDHVSTSVMIRNIPNGMVFADKSWLEKPRGSREFYDGVQKFVAHCTPLVNSAGKIRCPCKRCRNILFKPIEWIGDHITDNGWDPLYTVWDKHGEPALPTPPLQATPTPPPLMSDMTALLDDLSYIPPNNEHNEPTQGDIGETSNEPTQATRNEFEELYSSANEALYPGCDHVTRLDFMAKFTYFKVKGKLTDSIFNEMLEWLQYALPESKGYKFPPSYYAIKKTFKTIGLGYESIHACEHDCCLFRGEVNKDLQFCPVCNTSRWKDSDTPGKKVPRKVLRYFPIIPRLQRLYKSRHTAKDMIWHATGKCTEPGKMQHPVDGGAWKKFDMKYPDFAKEPRNVRLGLCADGFNPFGNLSQTYSMWPVILTTYNLPPWLCMKESNFMLTLLIPGPKSPGKDIDVYLRPLIEDLQVLWDKKGVETTDIVSGQNFNMRAMVLWTINDFPARSSLSGWSGQGYKACPTCNEETPSIGVKNKIAYVGRLICERHANNLQDPEVSTTSELFALANGPSRTPMSVNACVVDGVRYVVQSRDERRTTQNSGICAPGPDGEMSYGQLQEILEFKYLSFKVALFRVKWFDTRNNGRVKKLTFRNGMTQIIGSGEWWKNDQYILATQVKQVFYLEDPAKPNVKVVEHVNHKKFFNRGVIVVENEPDIIHLDNSSDLPPSTSGNDLDNVTFYIDLHIDGESTEVDAPPDIIDVPGEDDDISDDEDPLPHDLADSDVEDLINDDDGVEKMADVARAHGGDGGGEDPSRPPPTSFGCAGCFINRGKGKRKPNLGGVKAGRKTRERTRNQVLKDAVAANKGRPIEIGFEDRADNTVVPIGPYSTQWGNYFGEMIRSIPLYHPSWQKVPAGDKARLMATLGSTYNLEPHMRSERWPRIEGYIQAQFGKSYNTNKATLKREHWIRDPETGAYDLDRIRRGKPDEYTDDEWEKYINFWNDPANAQRAETNRLNRSKSTVVSRHGSRSIPLTRHLMKMTSATQEEPSEIDTFYRLHTVNGVFQDPEALRMYDRMRELEATGEHTTAEINAMVRGGKLRGHIPGVGPVMPGYVRSRLSYTAPVDRSRDVDFMMSLMRSDNRFADAFARYDSGGASGSGGSRARDSEGGEDGDDTGGEDGGDDTS